MKCDTGMIVRKGYIRKGYTKSDGTRVKSSRIPSICIRDLGLPGKGKNLIGKLKSGTLSKYGYHAMVNPMMRHLALMKSVKYNTYATTVRKLNAIRTLTKNTDPRKSRIYGQDIKWLQSHRKW
jgi:hypothetical protein